MLTAVCICWSIDPNLIEVVLSFADEYITDALLPDIIAASLMALLGCWTTLYPDSPVEGGDVDAGGDVVDPSSGVDVDPSSGVDVDPGGDTDGPSRGVNVDPAPSMIEVW